MPRSFQSKCVIETELPDCQLMSLAVMTKNSKKLKLELQTIDRIIIFQMNITENVCLMTEKGRSLSIMIEDLKGFVM